MSNYEIFKWDKIGDIGVISFEVPDEAMNTWTQEAVNEFIGLIENLEKTIIKYAKTRLGVKLKPADIELASRLLIPRSVGILGSSHPLT